MHMQRPLLSQPGLGFSELPKGITPSPDISYPPEPVQRNRAKTRVFPGFSAVFRLDGILTDCPDRSRTDAAQFLDRTG